MATHPESLGKYRIEAVLGHGAMGVVYRAHDPMLERTVALKTIRTDLLGDDEHWRERFRREARAAARCVHANIVTVFDYGEDDGTPYIVMEYVEGRELRQHLGEGRRFELAAAVVVLRQVLRALEVAHAFGIVHRDIKPANIILLADGSVKVTDFGIARVSGGALTQAGAMVGTPNYMAPEQFRGGALDARADLYACGVILFELLAGRRPFPGPTPTELMHQICNDPPPLLRSFDPQLPLAFELLLRRALGREPEMRFQSAAEFLQALEVALVSPDDQATTVLPQTVFVAPPAVPVSEADLQEAEASLVSYIGPMAKLVTRRTAQSAGNREEWLDALASKVPDGEARRQFLRRLRRGTTVTGSVSSQGVSYHSTTGVAASGHVILDAATLETAQRALAVELGPIARVLVKRAAAAALSVDAFWHQLAGHIDDPLARSRFLAQRSP